MVGARSARLALALLLLMAAHGAARAQLCFPSPQPLPGLSGAPDWWSGTTSARSDADEPRWAAAPLTSFDSDMLGSQEGAFRVLYDPGANQLVITLQALTDLGNGASEADSVYFGLSTNAAASSARAVRIDLFAPSGTPDPKLRGLRFVAYEFSTGSGWTQPAGAVPSETAPAWLKNAAAWVEPGTGADWVVSFRVSLDGVGLSPAAAFKIALGLHMHNELGAGAVDLTTPDVGVGGAVADLVQNPHTPTSWLAADAPSAGCASGIALRGTQIGTRSTDPNKLDLAPGAVNRLFATPSIPASLPLEPNLFQAEFRIARWGAFANVHAASVAVPGAARVINGPPGSPDLQTAELVCPANTATETCGILTPTDPQPCLLVELSKVPGGSSSLRFTRPTAYRNLRFEDLSTLTDRAFVSVKGLEAILGDQAARTLYLYVDLANMPGHGDQPLWLPARAMQQTRRIVETPPPPPPAKAAASSRGKSSHAAVSGAPAASPPPSRSARPDDWLAYSDERVLRLAWPTYAVHAYYELGTRTREDKREYVRLQPMSPFIYHVAHDGPLYGFSQALRGVSAQLRELQPNLYQLSVPNEAQSELQVRIAAEQAPKHPQDCTAIDNLKHRKSCACDTLGSDRAGVFEATWAMLLALACSVRLRRPRQSRPTRE